MLKSQMNNLTHSSKVRESASYIFSNAKHMTFSQEHFESMCSLISTKLINYDTFEESSNHPKLKELNFEDSVGFCFLIDSINFCFWPNSFEYEHLVTNIKEAMKQQKGIFSPQNILQIKEEVFRNTVFKDLTDNLNQIPERFRLLQEMAGVIVNKFNGKYSDLVLASNYDSDTMLDIIVSNMTGFQDHGVYKGKQVFYYKRAQILVGDINEVLVMYKKIMSKEGFINNNQNYYHIPDKHIVELNKMGDKGLKHIENLTCFADYRVPQVLNYFKVIEYSKELDHKVKNKIELSFGSEEEAEIRGVMIWVVELVKNYLSEKFSKQLMSIEVDWILWQFGEKNF